jgi:urease accessory protein
MPRAIAILRAGQTRAGAIADTLLLDYDQRRTPDGVLTGLKGTQVQIAIAKSESLATDDCLVLDDGRLIEIVARPEPLLEVRAPDVAGLARLAWHLGDRHILAELHERRLRVRRDPAVEKLLTSLDAKVTSIEAPFEPEGGAYSGGQRGAHGHHHEGAHDHCDHHDHDH